MDKVILAYEVPTKNEHNELVFHNLEQLSSAPQGLMTPQGEYDLEEVRIKHSTFEGKSRLWAPRSLVRAVEDKSFDDPNIKVYEPKPHLINQARKDIANMGQRLASDNFTYKEILRGERRRQRKLYAVYQRALKNPPLGFYFVLLDTTLPVETVSVDEAAEYMTGLKTARLDAFENVRKLKYITFDIDWNVVRNDLIGIYERHRNMAPPRATEPR